MTSDGDEARRIFLGMVQHVLDQLDIEHQLDESDALVVHGSLGSTTVAVEYGPFVGAPDQADGIWRAVVRHAYNDEELAILNRAGTASPQMATLGSSLHGQFCAQAALTAAPWGVLATCVALSAAHGAWATLLSIYSAIDPSYANPPSASAWSEVDLDLISYRLGQTGIHSSSANAISVNRIVGDRAYVASLTRIANHPAMGGGLVGLTRVFGVTEDGTELARMAAGLNAMAFQFGTIPVFGAWCVQDGLTYVTFIPNNLSKVSDMAWHALRWHVAWGDWAIRGGMVDRASEFAAKYLRVT